MAAGTDEPTVHVTWKLPTVHVAWKVLIYRIGEMSTCIDYPVKLDTSFQNTVYTKSLECVGLLPNWQENMGPESKWLEEWLVTCSSHGLLCYWASSPQVWPLQERAAGVQSVVMPTVNVSSLGLRSGLFRSHFHAAAGTHCPAVPNPGHLPAEGSPVNAPEPRKTLMF